VDGRKIERFSGWARGTAARPLTAAELDAKFMACAGRALPARDAGTLLAAVKEVEALTDVWEIFRDLAQKYVVDRHQRS